MKVTESIYTFFNREHKPALATGLIFLLSYSAVLTLTFLTAYLTDTRLLMINTYKEADLELVLILLSWLPMSYTTIHLIREIRKEK